MQKPLRIGWIPYLNLRPLGCELMSRHSQEIEFVRDHPSGVNKALASQSIHVAPASSICLVREAQNEMALPLGVAATGAVQSVYLGTNEEGRAYIDAMRQRADRLSEILVAAMASRKFDHRMRELSGFFWDAVDDVPALDSSLPPPVMRMSPHSATSVALAKIFYRSMFGKHAFEAQCTSADERQGAVARAPIQFELVIGDEALERRKSFAGIVDLGGFWKSLTGLPFVYAVWQHAGEGLSEMWQQRLLEAADIAEAKMRHEPTSYFSEEMLSSREGCDLDLISYWKTIRYRLGPKDLKGLMTFLSLARPLLRSPNIDDLSVKMLRIKQVMENGVSHL